MTYEKIYIGKGKQVPNLQIAKVTLKLEDVIRIAYERDGVKYVTFEVAKLKEPDKFGRAYTCYYSQATSNAPDQPQKASRPSRKAKKEETSELL